MPAGEGSGERRKADTSWHRGCWPRAPPYGKKATVPAPSTLLLLADLPTAAVSPVESKLHVHGCAIAGTPVTEWAADGDASWSYPLPSLRLAHRSSVFHINMKRGRRRATAPSPVVRAHQPGSIVDPSCRRRHSVQICWYVIPWWLLACLGGKSGEREAAASRARPPGCCRRARRGLHTSDWRGRVGAGDSRRVRRAPKPPPPPAPPSAPCPVHPLSAASRLRGWARREESFMPCAAPCPCASRTPSPCASACASAEGGRRVDAR
jgi:hypothetical protein